MSSFAADVAKLIGASYGYNKTTPLAEFIDEMSEGEKCNLANIMLKYLNMHIIDNISRQSGDEVSVEIFNYVLTMFFRTQLNATLKSKK